MSIGTYNIQVNAMQKTVDVEVIGSLTPDKAEQFIRDYEMKISRIKPSECNLKFNCLHLDILTQEMIPYLENCYRLYKSSGFGKVIVRIKKNPILKMQLNRVARNTQLTAFEVVEE